MDETTASRPIAEVIPAGGSRSPYLPVYSVSGDDDADPGRSGTDARAAAAGTPIVDPFGPRPIGADADSAESNGGLNALTGAEIVADIQRSIACVAHCQARIIALIDEVERRDLWAQWVGVKSLSSWVMHIAAVSAHTAREYVRVMSALRTMPLVREGLESGDVSYSKVREVTRMVGRIPDEDALRLAKRATGAQIGVVSRNYRQLSASRDGRVPRTLPEDSFVVSSAGPGRTRIAIELSEDDAAEIVSMLDTARQVLERPEAERAEGRERPETERAEGGERVSRIGCLMAVVRAFPRAQSSGAIDLDRARMLVHTSAEVLVRSAAAVLDASPGDADSVPAGTSAAPAVDTAAAPAAGTDLGTDLGADGTCRIDGFGGITAATAQRLACEALVSGIIKDEEGDVLRLGRSKRLASRRQKMALSARDVGCQFPGCLARRRCEAHHIRPWSKGGVTDLDNLVLLCRSHHIAVHEHALTIVRTHAPFSGAMRGRPAFAFFTPEGAELFPSEEDTWADLAFDTAKLVAVVEKATAGADPSTLGGGYGFDLGNCVAWMFEAEARHARENEKAA